MKIIDLLNKIANGEEVPKKIKWGAHNYCWCENYYKRVDGLGIPLFIGQAGNYLNDEVEIIEDKIEMLDLNYYHDEPANIEDLAYKVNEIIDYINKGE